MYQVIYNQPIIAKIAQDYYKEHGLNLDEAPQVNDDANFIAKLGNTSKIPELYSQIFPYIKYENSNIYRDALEKFIEHKDFPQILKDSLLTNSDLFEKYNFNTVYLHRIAKDYLDDKTLLSLEQSVFQQVKPRAVEEVEIKSVSYLIDKVDFYANMDSKMLMSTGQSQVTEFIKFLSNDFTILEKLKIDRMINYQLIEEEPKDIQLIIINPQDKKLLDAFMQELPTIFKNVLDSMTPEKQEACKFRGQLDPVYKSIDHMVLKEQLGDKEPIKSKGMKI